MGAPIVTGVASESEAIVGALYGLDDGFDNNPAFQAWLRGPVAEARDAPCT